MEKTYTFIIEDGNYLTLDCGFTETPDGDYQFTGTLEQFQEILTYGDFIESDIKKSIKEFLKGQSSDNGEDRIISLYGKFGDSICFYTTEDKPKVDQYRSTLWKD